MTHDTHATTGRTDPTLTLITLVLAAYAAAALAGLPQHGRDLLVAAQAAHGHSDAEAGQHGAAHDAHAGTSPPAVTVLPSQTEVAVTVPDAAWQKAIAGLPKAEEDSVHIRR